MAPSIPSPSLSTLLPAFLSHIPASFASPKPPPSLPPLLTPLTRSRLTHLSFSLSSDSTWLSLLTWSSNPSDGQSLQDHLAGQDYFFLHQPPSPNTYLSKGYRRLDSETLQCLIDVPELEIVVLFHFIGHGILNEEGEVGDAWKVHDVRLADDEEAFSSGGRFWESVREAEEGFTPVSRSQNIVNTSSYNSSGYGKGKMQEEEDDDDDYWGRYDDEDTESVAEEERQPTVSQQQSPVQIAAEMLARRVLDTKTQEEEDEDAYYAQYSSVEPVLDNKPSEVDRRDSISTNITSTSTNYENLRSPLTNVTIPSTKVSPVVTSFPKSMVVGKLEKAAEVHSAGEVAIRQHISTSVKSLYRLWKAGGMEVEDFGRFLEREVELIKVVEEAGELGS